MKLLRNVLMASGNSFKKVNVLMDDKIRQIGIGVETTDTISEEYDFSDCFLIPGAVDMHTHIFNGTSEDSKNLAEYTKLAVSGGYTTLADMPYVTGKPLVKLDNLDYYRKLIDGSSYCDMGLWGHIDFTEYPYHLNKIYELWSAGVIGFFITHPSSNKYVEQISYDEIMDLFDTIYDSDISFAFQGYDTDEKGDVAEARDVFINSRLVAIRKILRRLQDNPLHLIGIYDKTSIDLLNAAFRRVDLTYSVPVRELVPIIARFRESGYKKDEEFSEYVKLLFDSMKNGKLYTVSTETGKKLNDKDKLFATAYSGYPSDLLQWSIPWVFSELWKNGRATIQSCIRMVSENPAKRLGLFPMKGCIQKGSDADITIIDPGSETQTDWLDHKGNQLTLSCAVKATFLRGNLLEPHKKNAIPSGKFVMRNATTRRKTNSSCWN